MPLSSASIVSTLRIRSSHASLRGLGGVQLSPPFVTGQSSVSLRLLRRFPQPEPFVSDLGFLELTSGVAELIDFRPRFLDSVLISVGRPPIFLKYFSRTSTAPLIGV